jgi:hypothetical protein
MSNVVALKREADPFIVELLERWVDMAKAGRLQSVCIVGEAADDEDGPCYMNAASFDDRWRMLGALEYAKFNVNFRNEAQ